MKTSRAPFSRMSERKDPSPKPPPLNHALHRTLTVKHLASRKIDAAVINPKRVRDFAKGIGMDAKTDPIDAKVISRYAEVVKPEPMAAKSDHELKHGALVARRSQGRHCRVHAEVHHDHEPSSQLSLTGCVSTEPVAFHRVLAG